MTSTRLETPAQSLVPVPLSSGDKTSSGDGDGSLISKGLKAAFHVETGIVTQAQGSAYLELGDTKVVAACYGPRPTTLRNGFKATCILDCDVTFAPFSGQARRKPVPTDADRELSTTLSAALKPCVCLSKYPKSVISIHVTVLEDEGCALPTIINAACVSLVDAGIEMFDLLSSCTMAMTSDGGVVSSPSEDIVANSLGTMTLSTMSSFCEVTYLEQAGILSLSQSKKLMEEAVAFCSKIHVLQRRHLAKSVRK